MNVDWEEQDSVNFWLVFLPFCPGNWLKVGADSTGLVHLNDDDFQAFIAKDGLHFVKFYAPW